MVIDVTTKLKGLRNSGDDEWMAFCPCHEADGGHEPSLSVTKKKDQWLLNCFGGCKTEEIVKAIGLKMSDLFPPEHKDGCTIADLATKTGVPADALRSFGCRDLPARGEFAASVEVRYPGRGGAAGPVRYRKALTGPKRFSWKRGAKLVPYGLGRASDAGTMALVEGESDCWTLWHSGHPALGIPGAANVKCLELSDLEDVCVLFIVREADAAGGEFVRNVAGRLANIKYDGEVKVIDMRPTGHKDPNDMYLAAPGTFEQRWSEAIDGAVALAAWSETPVETDTLAACELARNDYGTIKPVLQNVMEVLERHTGWAGALGYNEFTRRICVLRDTPSGGRPGEWGDGDGTETAYWFAVNHRMHVSSGLVNEAAAAIAKRHPFHPLRDRLESLGWDGTARLDTWMERLLGAVGDQAYLRAVSAAWMVSAVARIMRPGCQADYMVVLEGEQGTRKSTGLRALALDPAWFTDEMPSISAKPVDAMIQLQGKWIIEFSELSTIQKSEVEAVKSFISRGTDRYREPYGRFSQDVPRQCVFVGTTNDWQYLRDVTGNRRFWPVRCGQVDIDGIRTEREQLWAEAVHRFRAGEAWHFDESVIPVGEEQEKRVILDEWEPHISAYLVNRSTMTIGELLQEVFNLNKKDWRQVDQNRCAKILRRLGWDRYRIGTRDQREWVYMPKSPPGVPHVPVWGNGVPVSEKNASPTGSGACPTCPSVSQYFSPNLPISSATPLTTPSESVQEGNLIEDFKDTGTSRTSGTRHREEKTYENFDTGTRREDTGTTGTREVENVTLFLLRRTIWEPRLRTAQKRLFDVYREDGGTATRSEFDGAVAKRYKPLTEYGEDYWSGVGILSKGDA